uniref:DNA ligase n=1 Tax=Mesocestoides corti TaxID=53468 RepID=A0A5K3F7G6_MESCO
MGDPYWKYLFVNDIVMRYFETCLENGAEGLVAKATSAIYVPNGRAHSGWWKLKPGYVLGLCTDLDCLVVGAYLGPSNSPHRIFSSFLCAVFNDDERGGDEVRTELGNVLTPLPSFLTFCRVSILKRDQLVGINNRLKPYWRYFDRSNVNCGETRWLRVSNERPDFWIPPRHSVVFQVHAAEIMPSSSYAAGFTLRFPRVTTVREDKNWQDVITISEVRELIKNGGGKLVSRKTCRQTSKNEGRREIHSGTSRHAQTPDTNRIPSQRTTLHMHPKIPYDVRYCSTKEGVKSFVFAGVEFCLCLSSEFSGRAPIFTKVDIENAILRRHGKLVQNPGPNTTYVIADRITAKVSNLIEATIQGKARGKEGGYDILKPDWLLECIQNEHLCPFAADHVFALRPSSQSCIDLLYKSGSSSSSSIKSITTHNTVSGSSSTIAELENNAFMSDVFRDSLLEFVTSDRLKDEIFPRMIEDGTVMDSVNSNYMFFRRLSANEYTNFLKDSGFSCVRLPLCSTSFVFFGSQLFSPQLELLITDLRSLQATVNGSFWDASCLNLKKTGIVTHLIIDTTESASNANVQEFLKAVCESTGQLTTPVVATIDWLIGYVTRMVRLCKHKN